MKKLMLLSVIIPSYNSAKYIAKCINSILQQGLKPEEYEIIVVNDGSTDNTVEIATGFCKKYPNIRIISQENKGLSVARNTGLIAAKGEYVHFVDSDDYLVDNGYYHIFNHLLHLDLKYDIIKFYSTTVDKYNKNINDDISNSKIIYSGDHHDQIIRNGQFSIFAWSLIIRRKVLIDNNIFFIKGMHPCEDMLFNIDLAQIKDINVVVCNINLYRYIVHENSLVTSRSNESALHALDVYEYVFHKVRNINTGRFEPMYNNILRSTSRLMITRLLTANLSYKELKIRIAKYKNENYIPIKDVSKQSKILNLLIKNNLLFYLSSFIYRKIFLPYFKQFVPRN